MWEKKSSGTGDVHDVNMKYSWSQSPGSGTAADGTAFTVFLAALNRCPALPYPRTGCFAGQHDWRLPTVNELLAIVDGSRLPAIDPTFGPAMADYYWSADTIIDPGYHIPPPGYLGIAWGVNFGKVDAPHGLPASLTGNKVWGRPVRAVRSAAAVSEHRWTLGALSGL